jgi:CRP-like cAMP-binding protein
VALFANAVIDVELVSQKETQVLFIPVTTFNTLLSSHPKLCAEIARDLAARLQEMTHRLVEAVTLSSPGRVCAELMRMARPVGIAPHTLIVRPVPPFIDMAVRINSSRETVSRTVSDLVRDGVLKRETGAIVIVKPARLKQKIK